MEVINPATEETIAVVPRCGAEDVDAAVAAASAALPAWLDTTPGERSELLLGLAGLLEEHAEELAGIESANVGKPLSYARDELPIMVDHMRFFAGAARVLEGKSAGEYMRGHTSMIRREPLGVVGGIAPWNYPLMMAVWKLAPALAAGNTQVLKPSEQTPLSLLRFAELAAGLLPAGVLNVVTGDGVPVGERIVTHPDVRLVSLTGDVDNGEDDRAHGGGHAQAGAFRARRQGAGDRLRRRRPRRGRGSGQDRLILALGPGLHGRLTRRGRAEDLRPAARGARAGGRVARGRRSRRRGGDRHGGPWDLLAPSRSACSGFLEGGPRAQRC